MIGQVVLSVPLTAVLLYGWLQSKRSWVGIAIAVVTLGTLYFVWVPDEAAVTAEALQLGTRYDLLAYLFVGLLLLVQLSVHLKDRQQQQVVTKLIRVIAINGRQVMSRRSGGDEVPVVDGELQSPDLDGSVWDPRRLVTQGAGRNEAE